ncbi:unnamed protein product, partial [Polarella glacialis]
RGWNGYPEKCAECGGVFDGDIEWDHVVPLSHTVKGADQTFLAICAGCHLDKTQMEGQQDRTLSSIFRKSTWDDYMTTPRPPPLVWQAHDYGPLEGELLELDMRRCRRSAMAYSAHDWAVFNFFDNVKRAVSVELCDFTSQPGKRSTLSFRCYFESATSHVPATCLRAPLQIMEDAWGEENRNLAKFLVNSMVGLWSTTETAVYSMATSISACDAQDYAYRSGNSYSLNIYIVKALSIPLNCIEHVKTDAVIVAGFAKKHHRKLQAIANTKFSDLPGLRRKFEKADINQRFPNDIGWYPAGNSSNDCVFRFGNQSVKPQQGATGRQLESVSSQLRCLSRETCRSRMQHSLAQLGSLPLQGAPEMEKTFRLRALII